MDFLPKQGLMVLDLGLGSGFYGVLLMFGMRVPSAGLTVQGFGTGHGFGFRVWI